jgi:3-hydroxyacyl-[acyl-carrier-protein] dehydratase
VFFFFYDFSLTFPLTTPLGAFAMANDSKPVVVKKPAYTVDDILSLLPHRFPFLLIDRVDEILVPSLKTRVGRRATGIKNVTINEPYFPGHFPHKPVMPGVLQIEAMAQMAALACVEVGGPRADVLIAGINDARFRRPVVPGDQLVITAEVIKDRSPILVVSCRAEVDGQVVSEAELIAKFFILEEKPGVARKS